MVREHQNLNFVRKQSGSLIILSVAVILSLYIGFSFFFLPNILDSNQEYSVDLISVKKYLIFLSALVLLFCVYLISTHLSIQNLQGQVIQQQIKTEGLHRRLDDLSSLLETLQNIRSQKSMDKILDVLIGKAIRGAGVDQCYLLLVQKPYDRFIVYAAAGTGSQERIGEVTEFPEGVCKKGSNRNGIGLPKNPKEIVPVAAFLPEEMERSFSIPVRIDNTFIGAIVVGRMDPDQPFNESDAKFLAILAEQAAISIQKELINKDDAYKKIWTGAGA